MKSSIWSVAGAIFGVNRCLKVSLQKKPHRKTGERGVGEGQEEEEEDEDVLMLLRANASGPRAVSEAVHSFSVIDGQDEGHSPSCISEKPNASWLVVAPRPDG